MTMELGKKPARVRLGRLFWRRLFLDGLLDGTDAACEAAGVKLSQALATRLKDRRFRAAWDAATTERLTAAESRLLDGLLRTLEPKKPGGVPELDKTALAAWRDMRDERRRGAAGSVPEGRGGTREPAAAAARARGGRAPVEEPGPDPLKQAAAAEQARVSEAEVAALIARVEAGIAEAEARLGLADPGRA